MLAVASELDYVISMDVLFLLAGFKIEKTDGALGAVLKHGRVILLNLRFDFRPDLTAEGHQSLLRASRAVDAVFPLNRVLRRKGGPRSDRVGSWVSSSSVELAN